jgi:hypothetical protein
MTRQLTIIGIWFVALVGGCAAPTRPPTTRLTEPRVSTTSFVDQTNRFTFEYPVSWSNGKMATTDDEGRTMLELAPDGDEIVQVGGGLGDTQSGGDRMKDTVEYFRGCIKGPNGVVDSTETLKLDGEPAWKLLETQPIHGDTGVKKEVAWLAFYDDRFFVLYYEAPEATYAKNLPAVERIVGSFRWIKHPPASSPNKPA